jgi:DNA adenine methylase
MKYLGGKEKIAKDIIPVILANSESNAVYVEPFVGSGAVISKVPASYKRFANDKNPYLIALHEATRDGWDAPEVVTEEEYKTIRRNPSQYPKHLVGFVSIACSFGGKVWGGYARDPKSDRNYAAEGSKALKALRPLIQGVTFTTGSYISMNIPAGAIVYCDPPYENTTGYEYIIKNFSDFWNWCNDLTKIGCRVFVSGYKQPFVGWSTVWEKQVKTSFDSKATHAKKDDLGRVVKAKGTERCEKLFIPIANVKQDGQCL